MTRAEVERICPRPKVWLGDGLALLYEGRRNLARQKGRVIRCFVSQRIIPYGNIPQDLSTLSILFQFVYLYPCLCIFALLRPWGNYNLNSVCRKFKDVLLYTWFFPAVNNIHECLQEVNSIRSSIFFNDGRWWMRAGNHRILVCSMFLFFLLIRVKMFVYFAVWIYAWMEESSSSHDFSCLASWLFSEQQYYIYLVLSDLFNSRQN